MFRLPELRSLFLCLLLVCTSGLFAQLKIPAVFSDNMVLQLDKPLPVWGKENPGTNVTVSFALIKNNTVELFSAEIKKPKYIRFAWDETAQPNFFNKEGLPCVPFRTDHL